MIPSPGFAWPTVPITFWLPRQEGPDAYGNVNLAYSDDDTVTVEGLYAPEDPADDIEEGRPHGAKVVMTLYLPKDFTVDVRGAKVRLKTGDPVVDGLEYRVEGSPLSFMRALSPGGLSLVVRCSVYLG